jgi:hypothetical protein
MKRNISISLDQNEQDNIVNIQNISNIINYSCDSISMSLFEYFEEKDVPLVLDMLLSKLRPSGQLIIKILNVDSIINNFLSRSISSSEFLNSIKFQRSLLSLDFFYGLINFNEYAIINFDIEKQYITFFIEKLKK